MNLKSILESILLVYGEGIKTDKLASITGTENAEVEKAIDELSGEYKSRGFSLIRKDDTCALGTNPENAKYIEALVKNDYSEELSRSALETIAIVAYRGPLTRSHIEFVRGVNSSFTLRNLLMRGLVERIDNPKDSRSYLYRVGLDFLKHFGLSRIEELPEFASFRSQKIEILEDDGAAASGDSQNTPNP